MRTNKVTSGALLLCLAILFQSLRLLVPVPPPIAPFVIGGLVNACLFVATSYTGLRSGLIIALVTPVIAWLQGQLPLPLFIAPVFVGNELAVICYWLFERKARAFAVALAAVVKTIVMYISFSVLLAFILLPDKLAKVLMFAMSWPQLVSGIIGGIIAIIILKRTRR